MEDKNYTAKEKLLNEARNLSESEDLNSNLRKAHELEKKWRKSSREEESLYDKELSDEFYSYINVIFAKESEIFASVEDRKRDIIARCKKASNDSNFKKASKVMDDLMEEWKDSGRCTKELDDELWAEFKATRDEFYAKRKEFYDNQVIVFEENKKLKEELIEEAKKLNENEDIKAGQKIVNELMDKWKEVGSAGRRDDQKLWEEFNALRKEFFNKKNAYYDSMKETYAQRAEAKKELIKEARLCLARSEFTPEEIEIAKGLRGRWKEVGVAARKDENALWDEFNEILNKYFDNLKAYND